MSIGASSAYGRDVDVYVRVLGPVGVLQDGVEVRWRPEAAYGAGPLATRARVGRSRRRAHRRGLGRGADAGSAVDPADVRLEPPRCDWRRDRSRGRRQPVESRPSRRRRSPVRRRSRAGTGADRDEPPASCSAATAGRARSLARAPGMPMRRFVPARARGAAFEESNSPQWNRGSTPSWRWGTRRSRRPARGAVRRVPAPGGSSAPSTCSRFTAQGGRVEALRRTRKSSYLPARGARARHLHPSPPARAADPEPRLALEPRFSRRSRRWRSCSPTS